MFFLNLLAMNSLDISVMSKILFSDFELILNSLPSKSRNNQGLCRLGCLCKPTLQIGKLGAQQFQEAKYGYLHPRSTRHKSCTLVRCDIGYIDTKKIQQNLDKQEAKYGNLKPASTTLKVALLLDVIQNLRHIWPYIKPTPTRHKKK